MEAPYIERAAAQEGLSAWVANFNKRFETVVPYDQMLGRTESVTGEPFVEITNVLGRCMSLTAAHAIDEWTGKIEEYTAGRSGTLYWRMPPELDYFDFKLREEWLNGGNIRMWKVYARLLISDRAPRRTSIQEQYTRIGAVDVTNG